MELTLISKSPTAIYRRTLGVGGEGGFARRSPRGLSKETEREEEGGVRWVLSSGDRWPLMPLTDMTWGRGAGGRAGELEHGHGGHLCDTKWEHSGWVCSLSASVGKVGLSPPSCAPHATDTLLER